MSEFVEMNDTDESTTEAESDQEFDEEYDSCDDYVPSSKRRKTYPFVQMEPYSLTNAPDLKDIASAALAISLWNHINVPSNLSSTDTHCVLQSSYNWDALGLKVNNLISQLPVPYSISKQINVFVEKIKNEVANWATYHFRTVFMNTEKDYTVYSHIYDLIWHPDCTINCKETAKNMLKSLRLSDVRKFRLLCTYCLKDEMQQMSSLLFSSTVRDYVDFHQYPLIYYWNCYFRNELHLIPANRSASIDRYMLRQRYVDNWTAKEYFFNHLSTEEQVQKAIWLIDKYGITYQKVVLMKLNESQRISVQLNRAVKIIVNYARERRNSRDILATWFVVRHFITEEQLVHVFNELLLSRTHGSILSKIWSSIDDQNKRYVLNHGNNNVFIDQILKSYDVDVIFAVLSDVDENMKKYITRREFFMGYCDALLLKRDNVQWLDRLLKMCFTDAEESKKFKLNFVLNSTVIKNHCFEYYSSGDVKGLSDMLAYLLSQMPEHIPVFKKNLLSSSEGTKKCVTLLKSETDVLNEIIADALSHDAESVVAFKKKLIFTNLAVAELLSWIMNHKLDDVKTCIDRYLTLDEDKVKLKKALVADTEDLIPKVFLKNDVLYFQSVLLWIFQDDENVQRFKNTIPVHDIFDNMLKNSVFYRFHESGLKNCRFRYDFGPKSFDPLQRFLVWYFGSASAVKRYKLKRVSSYGSIDMIMMLLRKHDNSYLRAVMKWLFEDDAVEIRKFKTSNKGKISNVF